MWVSESLSESEAVPERVTVSPSSTVLVGAGVDCRRGVVGYGDRYRVGDRVGVV